MSLAPEFHAPGPDVFEFPPLWAGAPFWLTKPVLLAVLSALVVCALAWGAFARPRLVPRGLQNAGEYAYSFVREQIARPFLGKDSDRWMPLLLSMFALILVWNVMGVVPGVHFSVTSHIAFPAVLAAIAYVIKLYMGFKHQGFAGFFKNSLFPPGLPRFLAIVLYAPLELVYIFVTSFFTHAVRLFANMFAGHMVLAFFSAVGFWFLFEQPTWLGAPIGVAAVLMTIVMTALEIFIQFLQAYLFAMLAAMYIGNAIDPAH
ncbi:F0F1 ATP synthase subunit A [Nonomuraea sp. NPDC049421]|uniref:F0F1 ATP synthase subunit A n=1 Tax=Nonomuraea sp. NPDC049421 TaxID=3155275 RepID=UPI0034342F17